MSDEDQVKVETVVVEEKEKKVSKVAVLYRQLAKEIQSTDLLTPDDFDQLAEEIRRFSLEKLKYHLEECLKKADGGKVWDITSRDPQKNAQGLQALLSTQKTPLYSDSPGGRWKRHLLDLVSNPKLQGSALAGPEQLRTAFNDLTYSSSSDRVPEKFWSHLHQHSWQVKWDSPDGGAVETWKERWENGVKAEDRRHFCWQMIRQMNHNNGTTSSSIPMPTIQDLHFYFIDRDGIWKSFTSKKQSITVATPQKQISKAADWLCTVPREAPAKTNVIYAAAFEVVDSPVPELQCFSITLEKQHQELWKDGKNMYKLYKLYWRDASLVIPLFHLVN